MTRKRGWKPPSRRSAIGARHVIERASLRKMRRLRERYYVPDNAALLVGGDVDAEAVFARVGELFATWKKGEAGHERSTPLTHPPLKRSRVAVVEADIRVPILRYLWRGPGARRDRRDTYIADVLCELTSRHDELPYTLSYQTLGYTGVFRVRQSRAASIVLGMVRYNREKFDAIGEEEFFTAEQLAEAKRAIRRKRIFSRQSPSSFLHTIAYFWTIADLDYHQNYLDEIDSVTLEEVRRVARTYIAKKPYVLGLMISEKYKKQYEISAAKLRRLVAPRDDD
jgi:zinc protease